MTRYRPRRPAAAPSAFDLAERDAFATLSAASLDAVRSSAETWRNGLSAFITLVTAGVVIKGRDTTSALSTEWRAAVTVLVVGGLLAAIVGLWEALAAQAGTRPRAITLSAVHDEYGSVAAYKVALATGAATRVRRAQNLVAVALVLLLAGVVVSWWAPTDSGGDKPVYLKVSHRGGIGCGTLNSADGGKLRLKEPGRHEPAVIPLTDVTDIVVVKTCG
ncbi:hypothetical protein [Streptomyces cylindrosporus]|uniref:Uncharacterized protein n=1 Tax=Streptomyces cylindrosporus TaxID=2927583 RepID=A0ABS9Y2R5_9ACTN|nr:hypothetical protein [Streptomyces cylindrosporus]MCI3271488.1 hypothetical protein [Streptomyces cylindrosporus]